MTISISRSFGENRALISWIPSMRVCMLVRVVLTFLITLTGSL